MSEVSGRMVEREFFKLAWILEKRFRRLTLVYADSNLTIFKIARTLVIIAMQMECRNIRTASINCKLRIGPLHLESFESKPPKAGDCSEQLVELKRDLTNGFR